MILNQWDKVFISFPKRKEGKLQCYTVLKEETFNLLNKKGKADLYNNKYLLLNHAGSEILNILSKHKMYEEIPSQVCNNCVVEAMIVVDVYPNTEIVKSLYYAILVKCNKMLIKCKKWYSSIQNILKRR